MNNFVLEVLVDELCSAGSVNLVWVPTAGKGSPAWWTQVQEGDRISFLVTNITVSPINAPNTLDLDFSFIEAPLTIASPFSDQPAQLKGLGLKAGALSYVLPSRGYTTYWAGMPGYINYAPTFESQTQPARFQLTFTVKDQSGNPMCRHDPEIFVGAGGPPLFCS